MKKQTRNYKDLSYIREIQRRGVSIHFGILQLP
jgi:hypothetical protein